MDVERLRTSAGLAFLAAVLLSCAGGEAPAPPPREPAPPPPPAALPAPVAHAVPLPEEFTVAPPEPGEGARLLELLATAPETPGLFRELLVAPRFDYDGPAPGDVVQAYEDIGERLADALRDGDGFVRFRAAQMVGWLDAGSIPAGLVHALREALQDPDSLVRQEAITQLSWRAPDTPGLPEAIAAELREAMRARRTGDWEEAPDLHDLCDTIERLGSRGGALVPFLIETLESGVWGYERGLAHVALGATGDAAAVPVLLREMEDIGTTRSALEALAALGPAAAAAAPELARKFREECEEGGSLKRECAEALAAIGGPGLAALAEALGDPSDDVAGTAAQVLAGGGEPALRALAAAEGGGNPVVREYVLGIRLLLGEASGQEEAEFVESGGRFPGWIREVLARGEERGEDWVVPPLTLLAESAGEDGAWARVRLLARGAEGPVDAETVVTALAWGEAEAARRGMERLGLSAPEVVDLLVVALGTGDVDRALAALRTLGPAAAAAVPAVARIAETAGSCRRRASALRALAAAGPVARECEPLVRGFLTDPDREVRAAARAALIAFHR